MRYTVNSVVKKTSSKGVGYALANVTDEQAKDYENVTFFAPIPAVGAYLEGSLESNDFKGKVGWKFKGGNFAKAGVNAPGWVKGATTAAKITSESVKEAQKTKQEGIEKSAVIRDSTLMTVAFLNAYAAGKIIDIDEVKKDWHNWKKFFEGEFNDEGVPF